MVCFIAAPRRPRAMSSRIRADFWRITRRAVRGESGLKVGHWGLGQRVKGLYRDYVGDSGNGSYYSAFATRVLGFFFYTKNSPGTQIP